MLQIIFLGTAGSVPTPDRNLSAILVNREGQMILFDCGEGTQRQMMRAKTGMMRLSHIFLTHLHADHFLGVPGLLETMAFQGRCEPLVIAGPVRTHSLVRLFNALGCCSREFEVESIELKPGDEIRMNGYSVQAVATRHSVPSIGYCLVEDERPGRFNRDRALELGIPVGPLFGRLQHGKTLEHNGVTIRPEDVMGPPRPGRKIVYSGDTRPSIDIEIASRGADLLIHDGALADEMAEWAMETKHSTAGEAAEVAKRAGVHSLVLTHISSRYSEDVRKIMEDAQKVFPKTIVAEDLMRIEIPFRDS